jgi:hypothetical protein
MAVGNRKSWMMALIALLGVGLSGCVRSCAWSSTVRPDPEIYSHQTTPHPGRSTLPLLDLKHRGLLPKEWKLKAEARQWNSIVIHHTATTRGNVESIHEAHRKRKDSQGNHWRGIGYHFVIGNGKGMRDGAIEPTFRWRQQLHGAHAGDNEHNQHGIGIALIGNFEKHSPTASQLVAIKRLVGALKGTYGISGEKIIGHGEIKATACPGKFFPMAEVSLAEPEILLGKQSFQLNPVRLVSLEKSQQ